MTIKEVLCDMKSCTHNKEGECRATEGISITSYGNEFPDEMECETYEDKELS